MKTGFLFLLQTINYLADRTHPSCLKVTQCSTSEIGDALLYKSCSLPIQVMTTGPLPAASKCIAGLPRITGTCPGWWKQISGYGYGLWCGFKWGPHHATSHLRSRLESQHQSVPGCAEESADPLVQLDPWCGSRTRREPTSPKRPRFGFRMSPTTLYSSLTAPSPERNPLDYFFWSYVTNMTSHNTKASLITTIRRVFAELPSALVEKACSQFLICIEAVIEAEGGYIE